MKQTSPSVLLSPRPVSRGRWAFYGYYVGHLACLGLTALVLAP